MVLKILSPSNATIVIVGDVDPDDTFALVKKYFAAIPPAKEMTAFIPRMGIKNRSIRNDFTIVTDKAKTPYLMMGYMVPGLVQEAIEENVAEWEPYALDVLATILNGYQGARLESNIIRKKVWLPPPRLHTQ